MNKDVLKNIYSIESMKEINEAFNDDDFVN